MTNPDSRIDPIASTGFERGADVYARSRPDYSDAALDYLIGVLEITPRSRVIELGAGTGKFTKSLLRTGAEIIAVEPVEAMRRQLGEHLPEVRVIDGTAESIPAADSSVDAVVAAQAFHWFRAREALADIHRVLKPGGRLALIWNVRDESVEWVRKLGEILNRHEGSAPRYANRDWPAVFAERGLFSPLQRADFRHFHRIDAEALVDRAASVSYIAALPQSTRDAVLDEVRVLRRTEPAIRDLREIDFPYRCEIYWCQKPDAAQRAAVTPA